jgi:aspartyl-tRNA(Asn)/glutamyl-tRNA(Gln) amidotransferase subunit B
LQFEPVIGLEVHAQLLTDSKIFCACSTRFGQPPNTNTCPVCLGMPGVLPVLNRKAVDHALHLAVALDCEIRRRSLFARKNYFYPDLPKGYQISQFELPLAEHGRLEIETDGEQQEIRITRIHLEEDAGKLIHSETGDPVSYVDLNRTGVPLAEIVSEPDLRSPDEAHAYLVRLRSILRYLGVCDGNMEEGSMRCDANISLRPAGRAEFGTKVELKNLNSFRFVRNALAYEIKRQQEALAGGDDIHQETRLFDPDRGETFVMRTKEEANDYRYFPEPDLPPLLIDEKWIETVRAAIPELPGPRKERFRGEYGLGASDAAQLVEEKPLADYFELVARDSGNPRAAANWVLGEILRLLNKNKAGVDAIPIPPQHLAGLIRLVDGATISGKIAKTVFEEMAGSGRAPDEIVRDGNLVQITDESVIDAAVDEVIRANPKPVEQFLGGREQAIGFLVGQVMKTTKGKANPKLANNALRDRLESLRKS